MFEFQQIKLGEFQSSLSRLTLQGMKSHKIIRGWQGNELFKDRGTPPIFVYRKFQEEEGYSISTGLFLHRDKSTPESPVCKKIDYSDTIQIGDNITGTQITSRYTYHQNGELERELSVITDGVVYSIVDGQWVIVNNGLQPDGQYSVNHIPVEEDSTLEILKDIETHFQPAGYLPIPAEELSIFWQEENTWDN